MEDGRLPKDILYGELASGYRRVGRPNLRYKDVIKRDMQSTEIKSNSWEGKAVDRVIWRMAVDDAVAEREQQRLEAWKEKRATRKQKLQSPPSTNSKPPVHVCYRCGRDCHSKVRLYSHSKKCSKVK